MNIAISPKTEKLLEDRMSSGEYSSPDEAIQVALEAMEPGSFEELDAATRSAIERADTQADRGEGIPVDEAFSRLRRKHFGAQ